MIVSIVLLAVIVIGLVYCVFVLFDRTKPDTDAVYSFGEAMDIIELPVLTMSNNGKRYRFIIDSGSNGCHLDSRIIDELDIDGIKEKEASSIATGNGVTSSSSNVAQIKFKLKKTVFSIPFAIEDLGAAFDYIKKNDGMTIHGILGSNFLSANRWVLDFARNVAYMKK